MAGIRDRGSRLSIAPGILRLYPSDSAYNPGMRRLIFLGALLGATLLLAADPTGTWTGDQPGPGGNTYPITFKLKAADGKLTGTMGGEQFEQPIQNGEVHGDDISFTVHLDFGDGIDLKYTGKVSADKIDFKVQRSGADAAENFVAKKAT
jgi:hypothetical protein